MNIKSTNVARKRKVKQALIYIFLILFGLLMIYPLIWMLFSCFKNNRELFASISLIPKEPVFDAFQEGWKGSGQYTYTTFFFNTLKMVVPSVVFTIISSLLVAYGFARFKFFGKKVLFALVIGTLMLPNAILIIPRYILFRNFGWLDSYLPIVVPTMFGTYSFFIFMLVQFLRSLPKELDEAAYIDGCNSFTILCKIIIPLCKPALFTVGLFQFMWKWNDFFNVLVYINSVSKFPMSLALRMSLDTASQVTWNQVMAMSIVTMLPPILLFFFAQKYFVEGISTSGLKG